MIRFLIFAILCLFPVIGFAAPEAPQIGYAHKVEIVVTAKRDPRILDMKINQDKQAVTMDVIVDKSVDRQHTKEMALTNIMQVKSLSLDDKPKDKKKPGKGIFDYTVNYYRPDGVLLLTATKPAKKEKIKFEDPGLVMEPATRAGAVGR